MKLAVMQPYLFPYIGYFQLIKSVDTFIIYDDVNYIKQGWINRNNILVNGCRQLFTLPLCGASSFKYINEITVGAERKKVVKTICQAYSRAPEFHRVYPLVEDVILDKEDNLASYLENSIRKVADFLEITSRILVSSNIEKDVSLKGEQKILHICGLFGASNYVNAIGGQSLYSRDRFRECGIHLQFLQTHEFSYEQRSGKAFVPNLSIIDVLMYNPLEQVREFLDEYDLI